MRAKVPREQRIFTKDFILICVAMTCSRMVLNMQNTVFPLYVTEYLGHSKSVAGMLSSVAAVAAIIMRPNIGRMIDKGKAKSAFIVGAIIYTLAVFGSGFITSIPVLIALRFAYGIGQSTQGTSGSTVATQLIPESRMKEGLGYYGLTASLSQALGPMIAVSLVAVMGYRNQFILSTGLMLFSFLSGIAVRMPAPKTRKVELPDEETVENPADFDDGPDKWWHKIIEKTSLTLSLVMVLIDISVISITTFITIYAGELGVENIGVFFTVQAIFVAGIRLFGGRLTRGKREYPAFVVTLVGLACALFSLFFANQLWQFILIAAVYGLCTGNLYVSLQTMIIMKAPPHRRGMANSTYFMCYDVGVAVGGIVWGAIADAIGTRFIYLFAAVLPIAALLIFLKKVPRPVEDKI